MIHKFPFTYEETLLSCQGVGLTINGNVILRDINVNIRNIVRPGMTQGQVIGFLGPSGIGKTQLSNLLSGITVHDPKNKEVQVTGSILIGAEQTPAKIGRIGVVQQQYPLLEHRNVYGNFMVVANNRYKNDRKLAESKVEEILTMLNLQGQKNSYPANLSGGQRQRVAIGQALINCEDFIIFDEPFSGLDINMINVVLEMLRELTTKNEKLTIIIISHDITATTAIADTLWLMGREKDANGNSIPGAKIIEQIDLIAEGLAWVPDIHLQPEFSEVTRKIRGIFPTLP